MPTTVARILGLPEILDRRPQRGDTYGFLNDESQQYQNLVVCFPLDSPAGAAQLDWGPNQLAAGPVGPTQVAFDPYFGAVAYGTSTGTVATWQYRIANGNQPLAFGAGDFSVSFWVNTTGTSFGIYSWYDASTANGHQAQIASTGAVTFTTGTGGGSNLTGKTLVNDGNWHHVLCTRTGGQATIYVDGVLDTVGGADTGNVNQSVSNFAIGAISGGGGTFSSYLTGSICDLRFYSAKLTLQHAQSMYGPNTRWDLYQPPQHVFSLSPPAALPAGIFNLPPCLDRRPQYSDNPSGTLNWDSPQAANLAACFPIWSQGGIEYDLSLNGLVASPLNTRISYDAYFGTVFTNDGSTARDLSVPQTAALSAINFAGDFSVSFWIQTVSPAVGQVYTVGSSSGHGNAARHGSGFAAFGVGNNSNNLTFVSSLTPINDGNWHHVLITYQHSSQNTTFYIDGVFDSVQNPGLATPSPTGSGALVIGSDGSNPILNGSFCDLRFYNAILDGNAAAAMYSWNTRWELYAPKRRVFFVSTGSVNTTLAAGGGTYTLTGGSASPIVTLPGSAGSFALTGGSASLIHSVVMAGGTGTYTLTGDTAGLIVTLPGSTGTYTLTGGTASLIVTMPGAAGSFTLTGGAASPIVTLPGSTGAFTLTGGTASLIHSAVLVGATGTYALTGDTASLIVTMPGAAGSYSLTGSTASPIVTLTGSAGSFVLTGDSAFLLVSRIMSGLGGSYSLTGDTASLIVTMPGAAGSYSLTGGSASPTVTMPGSAGSFILTGGSAFFVGSKVLVGQAGSFTLTGDTASLIVTMPGQAGSYSLTGGTASPTVTLTGQAGSFVLTGDSASLLVSRIMTSQAGSFTLTGGSASPIVILTGQAGSFTLTGGSASFLLHPDALVGLVRITPALPGRVSLTPALTGRVSLFPALGGEVAVLPALTGKVSLAPDLVGLATAKPALPGLATPGPSLAGMVTVGPALSGKLTVSPSLGGRVVLAPALTGGVVVSPALVGTVGLA